MRNMDWIRYIAFRRVLIGVVRQRLSHHLGRLTLLTWTVSIVLSLAVGFLVNKKLSDVSAAMTELQYTLLYGVASFGMVAIALSGYEVFMAPYRLWKIQQNEINGQTEKIRTLEDRLKPAIELLFEDNPPYKLSSYAPDIVPPTIVNAQFSILPKVISGRTIKNCCGYITEIESHENDGRWKSSNMTRPIQLNEGQPIDLSPTIDRYLHVLLYDQRGLMIWAFRNTEAKSKIPIQLSRDSGKLFRLTVVVEGDDVPSVQMKLLASYRKEGDDTYLNVQREA